jgi:dihydrofolate reductase
VPGVKDECTRRDVVVVGSLSLVHALATADLIDEYRLITFPVVVGAGDHLFATGTPADFRFTGAELADPAKVTVLTVLRRCRSGCCISTSDVGA